MLQNLENRCVQIVNLFPSSNNIAFIFNSQSQRQSLFSNQSRLEQKSRILAATRARRSRTRRQDNVIDIENELFNLSATPKLEKLILNNGTRRTTSGNLLNYILHIAASRGEAGLIRLLISRLQSKKFINGLL